MRYLAFMLALGLGLTSSARAATVSAIPCSTAIDNHDTPASPDFLAALIHSPITNGRGVVGSKQTLATYIAGSITKPSTGESIYGVRSSQTNGTGWGTSAEYRVKIQGGNFAGLLFAATPTNASLLVPHEGRFTWPIRRYEVDVLWTHEIPLGYRIVPYVTSGIGAIALDGGSASGWDRQMAFVGGAGSDVRLSRAITFRAGFTIDSLKASTYSDPTYRSTATIMVEPRIGLVWGFAWPFSH